jgi:CDP-archaeol synthase
MDDLLKVCYLFFPLLVGLAFHGLCIKFHWMSVLAFPIDGGRTFRGKPLFGNNKTYRGLVAVSIGTAVGFGILAYILQNMLASRRSELFDYSGSKAILVGLAVGAAAMLSELPNSFIKRQLGIAPGAAGKNVAGFIFYILDQIDLLVGAWLALWFVIPVTIGLVLWSMAFLFLAHQILTVIGYRLRMRATKR